MIVNYQHRIDKCVDVYIHMNIMNNIIIVLNKKLIASFLLIVLIKCFAMENVIMMNKCPHFAYIVMLIQYIQETFVIKEPKIIAILILQVRKIVLKMYKETFKKILNIYLNE